MINVPLNPMSATLGALVIAIATEFSVILAARFERERDEGLSVGEALRRTYALTGTAVLASGVTAIAGFAALAATDIRMLRDFGLVTVADLSVALVGVMLVLPATLVWADQRFSAGPRRRERCGGSGADSRRVARGGLRRGAGAMSEDPDPRRSGGSAPVARPRSTRRSSASSSSRSSPSPGINALQTDESGVLGGERGRGRRCRWPSSPSPTCAASSTATPTSPRTTARSRACPAPRTSARTPACEVEVQGAIRVCDLFDRPLVLSFWFTRGGECEAQQDVVRDGLPPLRDAGQLPRDQRPRRARGGAAG